MTAKVSIGTRGGGRAWYAVVRVDGHDVSTCKLSHNNREAAERCAAGQRAKLEAQPDAQA